jgi:hypothetical protein
MITSSRARFYFLFTMDSLAPGAEVQTLKWIFSLYSDLLFDYEALIRRRCFAILFPLWTLPRACEGQGLMHIY